MRRSLLLVLAVGLLAAGLLAAGLLAAAGTHNPKAVDEQLQGTWSIVHLNTLGDKGGRKSFDFDDNKFTLTFDKGKVVSVAEGKVLWQGTYELDPGGTPGAINIARRSEAFKQGIYEQKGDSLKLCLDGPANPRPTKFHVAKDSRADVMVFSRVKPAS
jgi:uncharacterized protein (TIGR03067 family)